LTLFVIVFNLNNYTIKQAWDIIPHYCGSRVEELLSYCEYTCYTLFTLYLSNQCKYYRKLTDKKSITGKDVLILANLIQTLDLPKKVFLDCLAFKSGLFDPTIYFFDKDRIWEEAKNILEGEACKCFCKQETHFNPLPKSEEVQDAD